MKSEDKTLRSRKLWITVSNGKRVHKIFTVAPSSARDIFGMVTQAGMNIPEVESFIIGAVAGKEKTNMDFSVTKEGKHVVLVTRVLTVDLVPFLYSGFGINFNDVDHIVVKGQPKTRKGENGL